MRIPSIPNVERLVTQVAPKSTEEAARIVNARLREVVNGFPDFDALDRFTEAMVTTVIDRDAVRTALARLHGAQRTVNRLSHLKKREFLGRLKSVLERMHGALETLRDARAVLRRIPDPTAHYSVCLAGFPNAGKSTLVAALTGADVAIASYEFTTRTLNYGTAVVNGVDVQVVDAPGVLNRAKANPIERQALLALEHLADAIVFVYDPLRENDDQATLFATMARYGVPVAVYASKQDLCAKLPAFAGDAPIFTTSAQVRAWMAPQAEKALRAAAHALRERHEEPID